MNQIIINRNSKSDKEYQELLVHLKNKGWDWTESISDRDFVEEPYYFRNLVKDFPDLMNINYREKVISDVLHEHGMMLTHDCDPCDGDYQDWKGYANCTIKLIPKNETY